MDLKEIILRIKSNNTILIVQQRNYIIIHYTAENFTFTKVKSNGNAKKPSTSL